MNFTPFATLLQAEMEDSVPVTLVITGQTYEAARVGAWARRVVFDEQSGTNLEIRSVSVRVRRDLLVAAVEAIQVGTTAATVIEAGGITFTGTIIDGPRQGVGDPGYKLTISCSAPVPSI